MGRVRETVGALQELRFDTKRSVPGVDDASSAAEAPVVALRVVTGTAELFGAELYAGFEYKLRPGRSYGIFTWFGCEVELDDSFCTGVYVSEETPMAEAANVHRNLEDERNKGSRGPRVAVVGPPASGKTSLCNILAGYAVRSGRKPTMVSLDLAKNDLMVPGAIAASVLQGPIDLYGEQGELAMSARQPLAYFVGADKVSSNPTRFREQVDALADALEARLSAQPVEQQSGMVIDTYAWSSGSPTTQKCLVHALEKLGVDVVLVMGHDRLLSEMRKGLPKMRVVKLTRSGGVSESDQLSVKRQANERMRSYFYGPLHHLSPVRKTLKLGEDVTIFLLKQNVIADSSIMPIGMDNDLDANQTPQMTTVDKTLEFCVLAVVHASSPEEAFRAPVAGFVHVLEVDVASNSFSADFACPVDLPSTYLLHGSIKWFEQD
ncbi:Protein CLP1-like [Hondaea fermentalgiana]|uniref:Protein CLP1-like n=1 Tax=Hondaea fermentalgiana TaxID=2315210 RepID=A0A2R5G850_9STRA|nr:Protein CLP1-like [Hondaea fermentalgiana]|eukprot:GBG26725.1 Protein CLP1-like [Hondaea fermentalgiana]